MLNINNDFIKELSEILPLHILGGSDLDKAFSVVKILEDITKLSYEEAFEKVFNNSFKDYVNYIDNILQNEK